MRKTAIIAAALCCCAIAVAQGPIDWWCEVSGGAGSGNFAPYYIASNRHGVITQTNNAQVRASVVRPMDYDRRFSYGFGADLIGGYASKTAYDRWDAEQNRWASHKEGPAAFWIQQLYGEVRYRCLYLTVGLKEYDSRMLDNRLSSGDLTFSGNARPMPGFRAGMSDFRDIPFTNGWVQIEGALQYSKPTDNGWVKDHFNYYTNVYTLGWWYNYKRVYFRTKPTMPLSVTVGMQAAAQFGGRSYFYWTGRFSHEEWQKTTFGKLIKTIIPGGGDDYYYGNHIGSWDLKARYRLRGGHTVSGYFQWPWEDGSGIGKLNGFDGLWGIEYRSPKPALVSGAVVEYLDFTNQSGPMHWDPVDNAGTNLTDQTTGADNYYNNRQFNGYAYYGMSIGTPMLRSPIYNLNGMMKFMTNRMRGFHLAVEGRLSDAVGYRLMGGWRKSWGSVFFPSLKPMETTSAMAEVTVTPPTLPHITIVTQAAFDAGKMYGNNAGALVTIRYSR